MQLSTLRNHKILIACVLIFLFFVYVLLLSFVSSNSQSPTSRHPQAEVSTAPTTSVYQTSSQGKYAPPRTINSYTSTLGPPEYNFQGSRTYSPNAVVYVYLTKGVAFIADPKTTLVYKELDFKPMTLDQFKHKYSNEIIDFKIVPTYAGE